MQAAVISVSQTVSSQRTGSHSARALYHGWMILFAAGLALASGLAMRLEWLTPALDLMQARTFGAALTIHGALAFYFILMPAAFIIPVLLAIDALYPASAPRFTRFSAVALALQGLGLFSLLLLVLTGGSEAGWNGAYVFDGTFHGARLLGAAGLCAALALVAQGLQATLSASGGHVDRGELLKVGLFASGVMALMTGATLALCMGAVLLDGVGGVRLFDPSVGGDPSLYEHGFGIFRSSAIALCVMTPLFMSCGMAATRLPSSFDSRSARWIAAAAVISAAPFGGGAISWKLMLAFTAFVMGGLLMARLLRQATPAFETKLVWAFFWIGGIQALLAGVFLSLPVASVFNRTTLDSTWLHLAALSAIGFGLPAVILMRRAFSPSKSATWLIASAGVLFVGIQFAMLPDALAGLHGLSYRANAYPSELQVHRVLGSAGTSIILIGLVSTFLTVASRIRQTSP